MDEDKVYPVQGTVTISTDEYKDLLKEPINLAAKYESTRSDYWREQQRARDAEEKYKLAHEELKLLQAYVAADPLRTQQYFQFRNEQKAATEE